MYLAVKVPKLLKAKLDHLTSEDKTKVLSLKCKWEKIATQANTTMSRIKAAQENVDLYSNDPKKKQLKERLGYHKHDLYHWQKVLKKQEKGIDECIDSIVKTINQSLS